MLLASKELVCVVRQPISVVNFTDSSLELEFPPGDRKTIFLGLNMFTRAGRVDAAMITVSLAEWLTAWVEYGKTAHVERK